MSDATFLVFEEVAVAVDKIVQIHALQADDLDEAGHYRRPIPEGSLTRIDTMQGYFWIKIPYAEVIDALAIATDTPLAGAAR